MPEISIIVPVFMVEEYLPRCIDSILSQTYEDYELLLIDDGSPDKCGAICDEYAEKDRRIRVFHKKNGGVSSARNLGLKQMRGNYISFIDADDVIHPQFLEILHYYAGEHTLPFCRYQCFESDISFHTIQPNELNVNEIDGRSFTEYNLAFSVIWNKLFHKSIISTHFFDTDLQNGEDTLFAYDCISESRPDMIYIDKPIYGYFSRETSAVATINYQGKRNLFFLLRSIYCREKEVNKNCYNLHNQWVSRAVRFFYDSKRVNAEDHLVAKKAIFDEILFIMSKKCSALTNKEKAILFFSFFLN